MKHRQRKQLDTTTEIFTPENIGFSYQLAGPFLRGVSLLIDYCVIIGILIAANVLMVFALMITGFDYAGFFVGVYYFFCFLILWSYGFLLESYWNGQTCGKRMMGIRVLTMTGQPINKFQSFLRNTIRFADMLPGCGTVGLCIMGMNSKFQRVGDIAAGTIVVIEQRQLRRDLVRFNHPEVLRMTEWFPPNLHLHPQLGKSLSLYVHRRKMLSPRRREDIASCLAGPLQELYGLPQSVNPDLFLCALYQKCLAKTD